VATSADGGVKLVAGPGAPPGEMQTPQLLLWAVLFALLDAVKLKDASDTSGTAVSKVIELLANLEKKVYTEGAKEEETHLKFQSWCKQTSLAKQREMRTLQAKLDKATAQKSKAGGKADASAEQIGQLQTSIAKNEDDLKAAQSRRDEEAANFKSHEKELTDAHDAAAQAIEILKQEAAKKPSLLQELRAPVEGSDLGPLLASLSQVAEAASLIGQDSEHFQSLLSTQEEAPEPDVYTPQSSGIVDLLEDMIDKTTSDLHDLRQEESKARGDFDALRQSLEDELAEDKKDLERELAAKTQNERTAAQSKQLLEETQKELDELKAYVDDLTTTCETSAADYETGTKARKKELATLSKAEEILKDSMATSLAQTPSYSFLQVKKASPLSPAEAIQAVRSLAKDHESSSLLQLAGRMEAILRVADGRQDAAEDRLAKVREMVNQMIARLEEQVEKETKQADYCRREMKRSKEKKEDLTTATEKAHTKLEQANSMAATLKSEIGQIQSDMSEDSKEQIEMAKLRKEEHKDYLEAKEELDKGLEGIRKAQGLLKDYYEATGKSSLLQAETSSADMAALMDPEQPDMPKGFTPSNDAGGGIMDILEHAESDMAADLAAEESKESQAAEEFEKTDNEAKIAIAVLKQDLKHKSKQAAELQQELNELNSDASSLEDELAAVKDYAMELEQQCTVTEDSYEEKQAKREAEIKGLREAMVALGGPSYSLTQQRSQSFLARV